MSSHAGIVVTPEPKGHYIEGYAASGVTLKPGMAIRIDSAGNYVAGTAAAAGGNGLTIIVVEDALLGKDKSTAYETAGRIRAYIPLPGDELQVLVNADQDAVVIADKLVSDTTGLFDEAAGTEDMAPFEAMEALGTITPDTLCLARFTGA